MRVLMLTGGGISNRSGGVGTMMAALRAEWGSAVSVRVIDTRGTGGRLAGILCFAGALLRFAAARQVDVVHLHMTTRGSMVRKCVLLVLAGVLGRPVIVHMHGADFFEFHAGLHPLWRRLLRSILRLARYVVVLGEAWRDGLIEHAGLARAQVAVIRNGVPAPPATPREQRSPVHLLFLGRLGERKGVPELLAALACESLASRPWRATLAGDGDVAGFATLAAGLCIADRVTLPGWVTSQRAAALLTTADVLVLPSHHEVLPMSVAEALAQGVAVVATPVGVLPEFLRHAENALLVPAGDVPALAAALATLIDDAPLRHRIGEAGRAVFRAELDVAVTARQMFLLYAEAAKARA